MHDIPLNDTQRIFAEKNHNLVYKFLHKKWNVWNMFRKTVIMAEPM